jgi:uncharacterized membrane protein HdeD (DUF308 family)
MPRVNIAPDHPSEPTSGWWLICLVGLVSVGAGVILIVRPSHSLKVVAVVLGIVFLLEGVSQVVIAITGSAQNRSMSAFVGVLGIVVGLILVRHPMHAVNAVGLVVGIWLVAAGILRLVRAIMPGWRSLWEVVLAILEVAVGLAIALNPDIGYTTLAVIAGIWMIINGVGGVMFGLALHRATSVIAEQNPRARAPAH